MQYFKFSPNAFFYESQFYQNLSEQLKIKVIQEQLKIDEEDDRELFIIPSFCEKFKYLFFDKEFSLNME